jgi:hypothetical protein
MSGRSWFYASEGKQQGPFPEIQLREFIGRGAITADTLVWTEGMANWQRAAEIPGLLPDGSGPPRVPHSGAPLTGTAGYGGGPLSIEFGIWDFTWRSLVLCIGIVFVIPAPWVIVMYSRWIVSCVRVPQRPNLAFTGRAVELMWFYAVVILFIAAAWTQSQALNVALSVVEFALYWLLIKWFVANLSSDGQPLGLRFSGSSHHPDSMDVPLVHALAGVADRIGRKNDSRRRLRSAITGVREASLPAPPRPPACRPA